MEFIEIDNVPTGFSPCAPVYKRVGGISVGRQAFYSPNRIYRTVNLEYYKLRAEGREARGVAFVSRGEPTLDINLGRSARVLKSAGFKVSVVTDGCMLWREDVVKDLMEFHKVILSLDAVDEEDWKRILRPHPLLDYNRVFRGIEGFSSTFGGDLIIRIHLIDGVDYTGKAERFLRVLDVLSPKGVEVLPVSPVNPRDFLRLLKGMYKVSLLTHTDPP